MRKLLPLFALLAAPVSADTPLSKSAPFVALGARVDTLAAGVATLQPKQPLNQASAVDQAYGLLRSDLANNWYSVAGRPSTNSLAGVVGGNGGPNNDDYGTAANNGSFQAGSLWESAQYIKFMVNDWKLRGHDPVLRQRLVNVLAKLRNAYPTNDATHGFGSDGSADGTVYVSDDGAWKLGVLVGLHEATGDDSLIAQIRKAVILINYRFRDTFTPANQVTDGALTYSRYGMLYSEQGSGKNGAGRSTTYEVATLLASLYLYQQTNETTFLDYPVSVYGALKAKLQYHGIYYQQLQLDPAGASDPTGYLLPIEASRSAVPVEGSTGFTIGGTMAMGVLAAKLYRVTGNDQYRQDALTIVAGMKALYLQNGKLINDRDPWTNGWFGYDFAADVLTLPGADSDGTVRAAFIATAKQIASTRVAITGKDEAGSATSGFGYSAEWSANTAGTVFGFTTWLAHSLAPSSNSASARPTQIMTQATSGTMVQAGALLEGWGN